jgi:threonine synthase
MRMGLGIERLVIATNANDIMARTIHDGVYEAGSAQPTLSPSMDIQVASNFERALFEASGRDHVWVATAMNEFARTRRLVLPPHILVALRARYSAVAVDDQETLDTIARVARHNHDGGRLIDPHTAVGIAAAARVAADVQGPVVVVSTAHPAKFPDAVARAAGRAAPLPPRLKDLYEREERMSVLPNDPTAIRSFIEARLWTP